MSLFLIFTLRNHHGIPGNYNTDMNQSFIDALMHFFSLLLLPLPGRKLDNTRLKLQEYIHKAGIGFPFDECLKIYNTYSGKYFFEFSNHPYGNEEDTFEIHRRLLIDAGHKSQENLLLQERLLVILSLLEFNHLYNNDDDLSLNNIKEIGFGLNISEEEFYQMIDFLYNRQDVDSDFDLILESSPDHEELEGKWINENLPEIAEIKSQFRDRINGRIHFRLFNRFNYIAFIYSGEESPYLNDKRIYADFLYSFRHKDILKFSGQVAIEYEEIEDVFKPIDRLPKIFLSGTDISYRYKKTNYSIKAFDFHEESGQLIGIIGSNGVGKSTILKLISNQLNPSTGKLLINGSDLIENSFRLKPAIGFIPHEQIIFPALSIYENLLFHAHLCLGNLNQNEIKARVKETLIKLQIESIQDMRPGYIIGHQITDYQRICIKIAFELLRKPYILYLDEPFSSLSYSDTKRLITFLKEEVNQGKLVILTSQLPNTELFNLFDKIWLIDQEGYLVYNGEPENALPFLKNTGLLPYYFIQSRRDEVSAEDIVKIIETKKIEKDGRVSERRQVSPGAWYDAWRSECQSKKEKLKEEENNKDLPNDKKPLPIQTSGIPSIEKQFLVFLFRNLYLRFRNYKYLLWFLAGVPVLGGIIAWTIRLSTGGSYSFAENPYIPLFLFLSVNLMFLVGTLAGAEEIYSENRHIERDQSLNLSFFSYKNSKLIYLLILSFFIALFYSIITNLSLGITALNYQYFLVYFSLLASGNLTGLLLSVSLNKLKQIYLVITFLLLPSLIFTGYLVNYDKTSEFPAEEYTRIPFIAEFSPCRWGYEALMVSEYSGNPYNRYFFQDEKTAYNSDYFINTTFPLLSEFLDSCNNYKYIRPDSEKLSNCLNILKNEFDNIQIPEEIAPFEKASFISVESYDSLLHQDLFGYLTYLKFLMEDRLIESESNIRESAIHLSDSLGNTRITEFKMMHHNNKIAEMVQGEKSKQNIWTREFQIFKEGKNIYLFPGKSLGRAHFFASEKRFSNQYIPTLRFNLSAIWLINTILYVIFLSGIFGLFPILRNKEF